MHHDYDIAVLELDDPINLAEPILARQDYDFDTSQNFTAVGRGKTETGQYPNILQMATGMSYMAPTKCSKRLEYEIKDGMLCAKSLDRKQGICDGQSAPHPSSSL